MAEIGKFVLRKGRLMKKRIKLGLRSIRIEKV